MMRGMDVSVMEPILMEGIPAVSHRQREAPELVVAEAGNAVLAPALGPGAGDVCGRSFLSVVVRAVILPHRAPLALAEVGPPALPALIGGLEAPPFGRIEEREVVAVLGVVRQELLLGSSRPATVRPARDRLSTCVEVYTAGSEVVEGSGWGQQFGLRGEGSESGLIRTGVGSRQMADISRLPDSGHSAFRERADHSMWMICTQKLRQASTLARRLPLASVNVPTWPSTQTEKNWRTRQSIIPINT